MRARGTIGSWIVLFAVACAGGSAATTSPAGDEEETTTSGPIARTQNAGDEETAPVQTGPIPVFEAGEVVGHVSREDAQRRGLTVIDLGDAWTPRILRGAPELGDEGRQPYAARYVRLSNEQTREQRRDPTERHLELFGIFPTVDVVRRRLADEERHACHDAVDDAPIEALEESLRPGADRAEQRRRVGAIRWITNRLERVARRRRLDSIDALADDDEYGRQLRRLRSMEATVAAIGSVQAHLRCEGTLHSRARDGVLDAWTGRGLRAWQSKHMIISLASRLDDATRATLVMDSRELDFRSLLRVLRERVVDASGILEDGTASNQWGTVLGRQLEVDEEFRWAEHLDPLPNGAPDLVSPTTEAAARALGWTDPAAALAWIQAHAPERTDAHLVAVRLPEAPDYHGPHMDLRVEIDRGDVWYTFPYTDEGRPRGFPVRRRPTTTLFARRPNGDEVALVRWNTTIGGWQPEVNPEGGVGMRYKESDVGERVWRDVIASPAWLPPPATPDDELLRRSGDGWRVNDSITGPGYDSAYGLALVIHHQVRGDGEDEEDWLDNGIRSHGSVSYRSILRGHSHGCHRLFNHLAVRMTSFLLNRRRHEVRGRIPASLRRELHPESPEPPPEPLVLEITNRGFLFELTPPVPVEVLRGNVRGRPTRAPAGFFPLPEELQEQAREQLSDDPSP
ncbi:MAG: hypothetical protein RLP09_49335 [Sandaracinaceae bacterium]